MHKKSSEMSIRNYPPCEDNDVTFCGICDECHASKDYVAVEEPTPDLVVIECAAAALHLLAAAAPGNANPTAARGAP